MRSRLLASLMGLAVLGVALPALGQVPSAPRLRVKSPGPLTVRMQVDSRLGKDRAVSTLEVERSPGDGIFSPVLSIPGPRRRQAVVDTVPAAGQWWYRVRTVGPAGTSLWAGPTPVTVEPAAGPPDARPGQTECPDGYVERVVALVNAARKEAGAPPLVVHPLLAAAAQQRAVDMAAEGVLSHDGWSATIGAAGYRARILGENIAYGYSSPESVTAAWMASSGHRANIVRTSFTETGVGCTRDGSGRFWWAQDFGG